MNKMIQFVNTNLISKQIQSGSDNLARIFRVTEFNFMS